jgi:hypothetical protein
MASIDPTPPFLPFSPHSSQLGSKILFPAELLVIVKHSAILNAPEKMIYTQMIECVAQFGIGNHQELFKAANFCFDTNFGAGRDHSIITIEDYLSLMGEEVKATLGENDYISPDLFAHHRPGFFLLTSAGSIHFLKENAEGVLVMYDPQKDAFVESASFPTTGQEKLVVLNKSHHLVLDTYYSTPTPNQAEKFYHEKQEDQKCGIHAIHAFLGFPVINETQLSLMKLEKITSSNFPFQIPELRWQIDAKVLEKKEAHASELDLSSISAARIAYFKDAERFKWAQTREFQADLGHHTEDLVMILKQLATQEVIEAKYGNVRMYGINIVNAAVKYAKEKKLFSENWDIKFATSVLEKVNEDLAKTKQIIDALDQKLAIKENKYYSGQRIYISAEYMALYEERQPYRKLEMMKKTLEQSIEAMKELEIEFERSDRLLIASGCEKHSFAMRKCENKDWVVIDSMSSEQVRVSDPLKWLKERQTSFLHATDRLSYDFITVASP